ncbi:MAG: 16S rRNA (uracil(1498)-N(3))-methyltransferase [Jatrophihabitantaceae bacterium]
MSTPPLFFLDALPADDHVLLTGDEGRHAARVKRIGVGENVLIGDGTGTLLDCVVSEVRADGLRLAVRTRRVVAEPEPRIVVVQALPKGDRAELAVEVMTELGVDEIIPWSAARSITQWQGPRGEKALVRWRRIAHEAAKQSRRARVPSIAGLATTAQVVARMAAAASFVLHESATAPMATAALPVTGEIVTLIGPEGGVSDEELDRFLAAGAVAVHLGEPVLRTSTAGGAVLAALSVRLNRWA